MRAVDAHFIKQTTYSAENGREVKEFSVVLSLATSLFPNFPLFDSRWNRKLTGKKRSRARRANRFKGVVQELSKGNPLLKFLSNLEQGNFNKRAVPNPERIPYDQIIPQMRKLIRKDAEAEDESSWDSKESTSVSSYFNSGMGESAVNSFMKEGDFDRTGKNLSAQKTVCEPSRSFIIDINSPPKLNTYPMSRWHLELALADSLAFHIIEDTSKALLLPTANNQGSTGTNGSSVVVQTGVHPPKSESIYDKEMKIDPKTFITKLIQLAENRAVTLEALWPELVVSFALTLALEKRLADRHIKGLLEEFKGSEYYKRHNPTLEEKAKIYRQKQKFLNDIKLCEVIPHLENMNKVFFQTGRFGNISIKEYQSEFGFYEGVMKDEKSNPFEWYDIQNIIGRADKLISKWKRFTTGSLKISVNGTARVFPKTLANITPYLENLYSWCIVNHICWNCLVQFKKAIITNEWEGIYDLRRMAAQLANVQWFNEKSLNEMASPLILLDSIRSFWSASVNLPSVSPKIRITKNHVVKGYGANRILEHLNPTNNWFNNYATFAESNLFSDDTKRNRTSK